jgi:hypothetical protein
MGHFSLQATIVAVTLFGVSGISHAFDVAPTNKPSGAPISGHQSETKQRRLLVENRPIFEDGQQCTRDCQDDYKDCLSTAFSVSETTSCTAELHLCLKGCGYYSR